MTSFFQRHTLSAFLVQFARFLTAAGCPVSLREVLAAMHALKYIPIVEKEIFRATLKALFVKDPAAAGIYDRLFEQFWEQERLIQRESEERKTRSKNLHLYDIRQWGEGKLHRVDQQQEQAAYSAAEILGKQEISSLNPLQIAQLIPYAYQFGRNFAVRYRKRYAFQHQSGVVAFRQTMRASLRYGGLPLELRYLSRKKKPLRFFFLCDMSRSMQNFILFFLHFLYAAAATIPDVEIFGFSTKLVRMTSWMKEVDPEMFSVFLLTVFPEFGGGTRIGSALRTMMEKYQPMLRKNTVLIVVSDGLDFGEKELVHEAVKDIAASIRGIWWLYPLPVSGKKLPSTSALEIARPYLAGEATVWNVESLRKFVSRFLREL